MPALHFFRTNGRGGFETRPYSFASQSLVSRPGHDLRRGFLAGEQLKLRRGLVDEHLQAVDGGAALRLSFPEQSGL